MIEIIGEKGTGKTEKLLYMSAVSDIPIMVPTSIRAHEIKDMAMNKHLLIPEPVCVTDCSHRRGKVLVDESLDCLFQFLIENGFEPVAYTLRSN